MQQQRISRGPIGFMSPSPAAFGWRGFGLVVLLSVLLLVPSCWMGFLLDDYIFLSKMDGEWPLLSKNVYTFVPGNPDETLASVRDGFLPWWTHESLKFDFFRPLSGLWIRADHASFGVNPIGYHLHSLLWWAATLIAAGLVLRRAFPGPVGTLAFLLYALDESHVMPAAWISNRHALVAVAPALLGLWAHLRWREEGWSPGRILAPAGFAAGLLASEMALTVLLYLPAYELLGFRGTWTERIRGLAPGGALLAAYAVIRTGLGYGIAGSGIYLDPTVNLRDTLEAVAWRTPVLLSGGVAGFSSDFWILTPHLRPLLISVGLVSTLLLIGLIRYAGFSLDFQTRRSVRWLAAGALLSLLPVSTTFPSDRLLLAASIGISAAVAAVLHGAWCSWRARRRWVLVGMGGILALVHLLLAPLSQLYLQDVLTTQSRASLELAGSPELARPGMEETDAVLLAAPDHIAGLYLPGLMAHAGVGTYRSWRTLSLAPYDHRITRTGRDRLELEVLGGALMNSFFETLFRSPRYPVLPGDTFDWGLARVEVMEAAPEGPTRVAFQFHRSLDNGSIVFLSWEGGGPRKRDLPPVGGSMVIPRTRGLSGL